MAATGFLIIFFCASLVLIRYFLLSFRHNHGKNDCKDDEPSYSVGELRSVLIAQLRQLYQAARTDEDRQTYVQEVQDCTNIFDLMAGIKTPLSELPDIKVSEGKKKAIFLVVNNQSTRDE